MPDAAATIENFPTAPRKPGRCRKPFVHFPAACSRVMRAILNHPDTPVLGTAAALLAAILICGLAAPSLFGLLVAAIVGAGVVFLVLRFPVGFCVGWLLVA